MHINERVLNLSVSESSTPWWCLVGFLRGDDTVPATHLRYGIFPDVALVRNDVGRYQCRWVRVRSCCGSVWLKGIDEMYIPVAHGEGKFCAPDGVLDGLVEHGSVAMKYAKPSGEPADGQFPHNPNGSAYDIAALSGNGGRALLMMPHPERAVFFTQRYDWTDVKDASMRAGKPPHLCGWL
ncbi:hypothetical protein GH714_042856 [Hevea brasiliensis]|uniref:Phosphoribosylformylglycinamidine synthase n=1 Tax=Hevea brasiliensis TaxID=3981 RepID=A0A6A6JZP5_HEVBR|nr:hypothetical protein GH714_042856 [Hevea brasiliensis]